MNKEENYNGWKRVYTTTLLSVYRIGWLGVWDALVAAITGNDRTIFTQDYTISIWVKSADEVDIKVTGAQMESNSIH